MNKKNLNQTCMGGFAVLVVAAGFNDFGQCNVSAWRDIVAVSAGYRHTLGLKADGTVVATGCNEDGQCDVSAWRDIVKISAGYFHTVAITGQGGAVAAGRNENGECDVREWSSGISDIAAGWQYTLTVFGN